MRRIQRQRDLRVRRCAGVRCGGGDVTCALHAGAVDCWGTGDFGTSTVRTPTTVAGFTDVLAMTAGASFACMLRAPGDEIDCWGANLKGELGNGTHATANAPTPVN